MYPYSRPQITEEDIAAVNAVLRTPMLTQGPQVEAFERAFATRLGASEAVACNSGTAALHLAYAAAGLGPERALVTSPLTFIATANAARFLGAPVYLADVDPRTGLLRAESVADVIARAAAPIGAITAVHLAGGVCDLPALRAIADTCGALLIEDACHAPGAVYRHDGKAIPAGSCSQSDMAVFSFHAIKHIAAGEGGAVTTRRHDLAERMRLMRNHGLVRDPEQWSAQEVETGPWYYEAEGTGYNYRMPDILCALALSQLSRLDESIARRLEIARAYHERLVGVPHLELPSIPSRKDGHAWHLFPLAIDFAAAGRSRREVMTALGERGVGTQVHYIPLHRMGPYRDALRADMSGADRYYSRTLSIPMYPQLAMADIDTIAKAIREVLS